MRPKCKDCKKGYKILTKEGLCAFCYKNKYKKWSSQFVGEYDEHGNPTQSQMKFKKQKVKGGRKGKKGKKRSRK